jgi:Pyridoxamine 5'-phosphate oxidase
MKQGSLELLPDPVSRELLQSKIPARLAYIWTDGTPRVVPIWFHWDGKEFVMATPPKAPKLRTLSKNTKVALSSKAADSSHENAALRNDNSLGIFKLHHPAQCSRIGTFRESPV